MLPPLPPAQPELQHVVVPPLQSEAGPARPPPTLPALQPHVVVVGRGGGDRLQPVLSQEGVVPQYRPPPRHPEVSLPPLPLNPVRETEPPAARALPLPPWLETVQLQGLGPPAGGLEAVAAAAVVTEAEPGHSSLLPVDAAPVARPGSLVHLDQLGVQEGDVLLAILPLPPAQALPLQGLAGEAAAPELEVQLVARLAGARSVGGAGAGLAGVAVVSEAQPPLAEQRTENLLEAVPGSVVAPGLVEHHLPGLPGHDTRPAGTDGLRLLGRLVALVDRVQGVDLQDVGRPHLQQGEIISQSVPVGGR